MAAFDPVKVLENVINRLRHHDPSGFFDDPVTDKEAPNYSQVITQPMSFSCMREKVRNREYRTWGAFICDFELICANAVVYNQQKSKVHKAAKTMLRQGKIDLQDAGLEGRKAIYLLHPGGPAEAASEESEEFSAQGLAPPINAFLLCPGHTPLPPPPADDEDEKQTCYSCYSDTDSEDTRGQGAPTLGDMDRLLKNLDKPVVWQPWSGGTGASSSGPAKEEILPDWRRRRRPIEWQCRWLELRLLELQSHRHRYARSSKNPRNLPAASLGVSENGHQRKQKQKVVRHPFPDISSDKLLKHPFLGLRGRSREEGDPREAVEGMDSEKDKSSNECSELKLHHGVDQEDLCFGAQVHVALGVLTEEMKKVMGLLQARRKMCQSHQQLPPPRPLKKAPSMTPRKALPRVDSKRSRREFEMEDMVTPVGLAQTTATFERVPKTDIAVPRVVVLSTDEQLQRQKALDVWRPLLKADSNSKTVPNEVSLLVKSEDETSDEDFTDEAFLIRHKDMESTEHERHVSVFGPPKKQKEASGGARLLQRTSSVPSIRDPSIGEPLHGKSFPLSYLTDMGVRGRARGRRPIIPQRPRPALVQGGRRGGMSIGIPMLTHTMPQLNQSQSVQTSSAMTVQGHAPIIPNLVPFPPTIMTSMPHILLPFSAPLISAPRPEFSMQTTSFAPDPSMLPTSQKYEDFQAPLNLEQEVVGVGISDLSGVTFSATTGIPVANEVTTTCFQTVPSDLGHMSTELNGNNSSEALGVQLVVHGQPAVQMPPSVPVDFSCEEIDGAQTDVDDDVAPEPDVRAMQQTEVVDSSPSRELASIIQASSLDWTKPVVIGSSAHPPDSEQLLAEPSVSMPYSQPVDLKNQMPLHSSGPIQASSASPSLQVPGIPCPFPGPSGPLPSWDRVVDESIVPPTQLAVSNASNHPSQNVRPFSIETPPDTPVSTSVDQLPIPSSRTPWAAVQETESQPLPGLATEQIMEAPPKSEDSKPNFERLPSGVLEVVDKSEQPTSENEDKV